MHKFQLVFVSRLINHQKQVQDHYRALLLPLAYLYNYE
uniref:Uncharacterized protein n=1 Tax=Anguilla anguilla TaxID=7936 RepID=A0A0E9R606_ANGAN